MRLSSIIHLVGFKKGCLAKIISLCALNKIEVVFPINIIFKETHKLDTISTDKIVSDINVESLGLYRFAVNKKELDDILITISELHNN